MSDSGIISGAFETGKGALKGFVKSTTHEVSQTVSQGVGQITGEQQTPEQIAQNVVQLRQKEAAETPQQIAHIESQIRQAGVQREERQRPAPITQQSKPAMVDVGKLMDRKRDNRENKIAAA